MKERELAREDYEAEQSRLMDRIIAGGDLCSLVALRRDLAIYDSSTGKISLNSFSRVQVSQALRAYAELLRRFGEDLGDYSEEDVLMGLTPSDFVSAEELARRIGVDVGEAVR